MYCENYFDLHHFFRYQMHALRFLSTVIPSLWSVDQYVSPKNFLLSLSKWLYLLLCDFPQTRSHMRKNSISTFIIFFTPTLHVGTIFRKKGRGPFENSANLVNMSIETYPVPAGQIHVLPSNIRKINTKFQSFYKKESQITIFFCSLIKFI